MTLSGESLNLRSAAVNVSDKDPNSDNWRNNGPTQGLCLTRHTTLTSTHAPLASTTPTTHPRLTQLFLSTASMPRRHRPDRRRNAQRQFGAAFDVISGAQSQVQKPSTDFQVHGRGRTRSQEPPPQQYGGDDTNTRREGRIPLVDRITRDEQPQEGCGNQSAPEQKPATGKRGRSNQSEQQSRKKARMNPTDENASAPKKKLESINEAATQKSYAQKANVAMVALTSKSEEERRALRAQRFAPPTVPGKAAAVNEDISMKDADGNAFAKESNGDRTVAPTSNPAEAVNDAGTVAAARNNPPKESSNVTIAAVQGEHINVMPDSKQRKEPDNEAATHPKKPVEWHHTPATKNPQDRKHPSVTTPTPKGSYPNKHNMGSGKRPLTETADSEQHSRKKPRLEVDTNHLPAPEHNETVSRTEPRTKKTPGRNTGQPTPDRPNHSHQVLQTPQVIINDVRAAPEEPFPEHKLDLFPYGSDSVPILYSSSIEHSDSAELLTETSLYLRQEALVLLRQRNWTSKDFGRKEVPKKGRTRIIDDCDLYLRSGKIYVATERGLLLAADYFKLINIPDTQPIRFNGLRPAWAKLAESKRHYRRIEEASMLSDAEKAQGLLELISGTTVMVFERVTEHYEGQNIELAYGMRLDTGAKGWFSYDITCPMDWGKDPPAAGEASNTSVEDMIDWTKFSYARLAAFAAAATEQAWLAQAMPPTAPQTTTAPTTPAGTISAPVTSPAIAIEVSKQELTTEVSSVATPQQKREILSEHTAETVLVEVVDTPTQSRTSRSEARTEQLMISIAAGPLRTSTKEEKPTAADSEQEVNTQEPSQEHHSVEEGPDEEGPRQDSPQHNATKDEQVAKNEAIAQTDTSPEQVKPSPPDTVRPQQTNAYEEEDEVDYSDGEL